MLKCKRGISVSYLIIELILLMIVSYALLTKSSMYGSGESDIRLNLARDTARTIETYHAIPGNMSIEHYRDFSNYDVIILPSSVDVERPGTSEQNTGLEFMFQSLASYSGRNDAPINISIKKATTLIFDKNGTGVSIHAKS